MFSKRAKPLKPESQRKRILEQDKSVTIRVTADLKSYLKRWAAASASVRKEATAGRIALETFRDLTEGLGSLWWELVRRADASGRTTGYVIATLVRQALDHEQRPKK